MQQTARDLPADHRTSPLTDHVVIAAQVRETDDWVHIANTPTRHGAHNLAHLVRSSKLAAYRGHLYEARGLTGPDGVHQTWGRWIGPRGVRRPSTRAATA